MKKRALISLSDKTGILEFARELNSLGYEIISTGGTAKYLTDNGLPVIPVSDITGFPECLDGRVKTLDPHIHAGILAMRGNAEHMAQLEQLNINTIDIVAVNLYPFKATILRDGVTLEEAIENIDIGGPTMIRAAAKNWQDVAVIVDSRDYDTVLRELRASGEVARETKLRLAYKVFEHTAAYDALIASYLRNKTNGDAFPDALTLTYEKAQSMRYGENPHQNAAFYREIGRGLEGTLIAAEQLWGKELSYNNIGDAAGALDTLKEFGNALPCAVAVKHANPCGVGLGNTLPEAYKKAYDSDPTSIFGGIVALNRTVDPETAQELHKIFLEIIIAPDYSPEALEILKSKKNLRLLRLPDIAAPYHAGTLDMKKVPGGLLVQDYDTELYDDSEIKVVTSAQPTKEQLTDMRFGMKCVKHVKSNAIVLVRDGMTVGVGPGQTNRVTALELAIKYAGERARGSVLASDAFFPFDDCVEMAAKAGIAAIVQPGGSIRDEDSIAACDKYGIPMVFTGKRHFKH